MGQTVEKCDKCTDGGLYMPDRFPAQTWEAGNVYGKGTTLSRKQHI